MQTVATNDNFSELIRKISPTKVYDKCDDFDFDIVFFPFLDEDIPRAPSYGFTYLNVFGLLECRLEHSKYDFNCKTSQTRLSVSQTSYFFQNFVDATKTWYQNLM